MTKTFDKESNFSYEMLEKDFSTCREQFLNESGLIPEGKELFVHLVDEHKKFTPYLSPEIGVGQQRMLFEKDYLIAIYDLVSSEIAEFSKKHYKKDIEICRLVANSILYCSFLHEFVHFIRNHHECLKSLEFEDNIATKLVELDADTIAACMLWDFIRNTSISREMKVMALVMGVRGQFEIIHRYFQKEQLESAYGLPPISRSYIALSNAASAPYFDDFKLPIEVLIKLLEIEIELFNSSVAADVVEAECMSDTHLWHENRHLINKFAHSSFQKPTFFYKSMSKKRKMIGSLHNMINQMKL